MNTLDWATQWAALLHQAPTPAALPPLPQPAPHAPHAVILAPHPDDECIVGALPLRLRQLAQPWRVTAVAVTLGSRRDRRAARHAEMTAACAVLGFELQVLDLDDVRPDTATRDPALWAAHTARLAALIRACAPQLVLRPHAADANPTHEGVHRLAEAALQQAAYGAQVADTEFWQPMLDANLLVQSAPEDVARLVDALALHVGEVERNPYHLRLPAWLMDNVRRGGERLGGAGSAPPRFAFGTLYKHVPWQDGQAGTPHSAQVWGEEAAPPWATSASSPRSPAPRA